jgi:hypothetical protein
MIIVIPVVASRMPPIMTDPKKVLYSSIPSGASKPFDGRLSKK